MQFKKKIKIKFSKHFFTLKTYYAQLSIFYAHCEDHWVKKIFKIYLRNKTSIMFFIKQFRIKLNSCIKLTFMNDIENEVKNYKPY